MSVRNRGPEDVYLTPGLLYSAPAPCRIAAIVGSCVTLCLWSPRLLVGGANHYVLPRGAGREASTRHGDTALPLLLARLVALGCVASELHARVYGGAAVTDHSLPMTGDLGEQNVLMAESWLAEMAIPVVDRDVRGHHARRVLFDVSTGRAEVMRVAVSAGGSARGA